MKKLLATILFALILSVATSVSWGQVDIESVTWESVTWEGLGSMTWE